MKKNRINVIPNLFRNLFTTKMLKRVQHDLLILSAATMAFAFASCSNLLETEEKDEKVLVQNQNTDGKTVVKVSLGDEISDARTVLPTYSKSNLTSIKLYGKSSSATGTLSESDTYLLDSWDDYASLMADDGVVLDADSEKISGTWTFLLTALSNGSKMSATSDSVSLSTTKTNTISFSLAAASGEITGTVKIELESLEDMDVQYVKYYWYNYSYQTNFGSYTSYDSTSTTELTVSTDSTNAKSAVFEKSDVIKGSYYIAFYFFDADKNLVVQPWVSSVIVKAGALSYKKLEPSSLESNFVALETHKVTYNFNNGTTENNTYVQDYYPASVLLGEYSETSDADTTYTGTAPEGKKFRGWNTKADGSGTRYSPGDNLSLTSDLTLYAQWTTYDKKDGVWTISSADEFRAFFSYSEDQVKTYGSTKYPVKLLNDISDLTSWKAVSFNGTFDGNSKSLTYTLASSSEEYASLFKTLGGGGTVKNLTLTGLSLSSSANGGYVASIASVATSVASISSVTLEKSSVTSTGENSYVGGLIAYAADSTSTWSNSIAGTKDSPVNVTGKKASYVGGLVGYAVNCNSKNYASLSNSVLPDKIAHVNVTGSTSASYQTKTGAYAGGIKASTIAGPQITYPTVTGYYAGGGAGYVDEDAVIDSANIKSNDSYPVTGYYAGGIAGMNAGSITDPIVQVVTVTTKSYGASLGGIAGENTGTITGNSEGSVDTFDTAVISGGEYGTYIGGAAGLNSGSIDKVIIDANTTISSAKTSGFYAGGIAGCNEKQGELGDDNVVREFQLECEGGSFGYVIGKNDGGTVSEKIENKRSESYKVAAANNGTKISSTISKKSSSYWELTLERTSKVTLSITDAEGQPAIYAGITTSKSADVDVSETSSTVLAYTGKVDGSEKNGGTGTASAGYLAAGTYYIVLQNKNFFKDWDFMTTGNTLTYTID